jgi:hypothetical protein
MSSAGGGPGAAAGGAAGGCSKYLNMSVANLKGECYRLGIRIPSSASKGMLQQMLLNHAQPPGLNPQVESMQSVQQRQDEQLKDADIDDLEAIQCTICLEEYNENNELQIPRLLPCGHTFCTACLKGFFGQKQPHTVECPTCMAKHQIPRPAVVDVLACPISKSVPINFYAKEASARPAIFLKFFF